MATVSLCVVSSGPAERLRALLELVRPHVDQVVVAVDGRGDERVADWCADLADRRLLFAEGARFEHVAGWALDACSGDWQLRLDDDEVPSAALLAALPRLTGDRRVIEYAFSRRWLHPGPDTYIDATPWREEHQRRLARNLPGLRPPVSGRVHEQPLMQGPRRIVADAIYHLDVVVNPWEWRLAKARRYERLRELAFNAFPVNGMYLPEAAPGLATRPVDAADRPLIGRVLAGAVPPPPGARERSPVTAAAPGEIGATLAGAPDDPVAGSLRVVASDDAVPPGETLWWEVDARNDGPGTWPAVEDEHPRVRVGSRVLDPRGQEVASAWAPLTERVPPGAHTRVLVPVETPAGAGAHVVAIDLVVAGREWLDGGPRVPVLVTPDAPLARAAEAVRALLR